ncbi:MAG: N-acetylmuramic acid 6-phosphate etherase, partial [Candidatus Hydrogenedentales bacterium]
QNAAGRALIVGGKGTMLGDDGSGYQIALTALRGLMHALDVLQTRARLADALAKAAGLDVFENFVAWSHRATKEEVAQLTPTILEFANNGDDFALKCLESQAALLAGQAASALTQLHLPPDTPIHLGGGLFEHSARYRAMFERALLRPETTARPVLAALRGHRAVAELAFAETLPSHLPVAEAATEGGAIDMLPPTEGYAPDATPIDCLTAREIVERMNEADASVAGAVKRSGDGIAKAIAFAADAIASGGRIIYTGAGTSGRLGVLDASECPPTFGVPPERVVGIMAGGERALRDSVEGAEDDECVARTDLTMIHPPLGTNDVVVGIAASGTTPYVKSGLRYAAACGARTVLLCCNPRVNDGADCVIAIDTGPEVVAGSTRLKAGTATKMVLNTISTGAMALAGYVYEGRMVRMRAANSKLLRRAARIVAALTGLSEDLAARRLEEADNDIAVAVLMTRLALEREPAAERLQNARGNLRRALEGS